MTIVSQSSNRQVGDFITVIKVDILQQRARCLIERSDVFTKIENIVLKIKRQNDKCLLILSQ